MPTFFYGFGEDSTNNRFRLLQRGFAGSTVTADYLSPTSSTITRQIYGGFVYGSNAYFLALDTEGALTTMYIIRVCNDGELDARYELQLTCGGTTLSSSSVITGVSEVDGTLVVSVDGRVCSYNLTTIDNILDNFFTSCLDNQVGVNDPQFGNIGACVQVTGVSFKIAFNFFRVKPFHRITTNRCVFLLPVVLFTNLILNFKSASNVPNEILSGSLLMSEGVNTSLAISVEGNLFLFVATANSVEKVSVTIINTLVTPPLSISSLLVVVAPLYSTPCQYLLLLLLSAGHQQ